MLEDCAGRALDAVGKELEISPDWEVDILACGDEEIANLNSEFRGKPKPTNVLSWPAYSLASEVAGGTPKGPPEAVIGDPSLGDIAISFETCEKEAEQSGRSFEQHICHLLTHACLHLLGYDHENDEDATVMEALEVKILESLNIPDPYRDSA